MANTIKSSRSTELSYVLFINKTDREVNVYWVDYNGEPTFYSTLMPNGTYKVNTFRSHPWIFRDFASGERMHVGQQNTFWPESYLMRNPRNLNQWIPCRKQIIIHLPLISLRNSCLWRVLKLLVEAAETPAKEGRTLVERSAEKAIEKLLVPRTLQLDLRQIHSIHQLHGNKGSP